MSPRIPPLPEAEQDEAARELLASAGFGDGPPLNIFLTLVRHPRLFRRWLPFGGVLLTGSIPPRERELLILRTGHNCASDYEWHQHVRIGLDSGLTEAEVDRVRSGPDAGWEPFDAALLRAADELHADSRVGDATWAALAERYDEKQLIELCMLVGQYHLVAFTLNSLGVEIES
jgi:4-carboxymuconolactone decarboxylase